MMDILLYGAVAVAFGIGYLIGRLRTPTDSGWAERARYGVVSEGLTQETENKRSMGVKR